MEQAKSQLRTALDMIEEDMAAKTWAMGDAFSMADCAAAPSLFYANEVMPFGDSHQNAAAIFRTSHATPFVRASGGGGEAVLRPVPEVNGRREVA